MRVNQNVSAEALHALSAKVKRYADKGRTLVVEDTYVTEPHVHHSFFGQRQYERARLREGNKISTHWYERGRGRWRHSGYMRVVS